jgi:2',3'-cyclic-nucleotide 2'-phosphodiesterase (5'-nucleotidase family)
MRTALRFAWVAAATLAGLASCIGWRPRLASEEIAEADRDPAAFRAFFTADNEGFIAPCGCEASQYGGYARRATYLRHARRPGDLVVDLGNLVLRQSPVRKLAYEASVEGLAAQGYDVLVPGQCEFLAGDDFPNALAKAPGLHVVCANVRRADGSKLFDPWHLHSLEDGRTVALVGIVEPFAGLPDAFRAEAPFEAISRALTEIGGRADAVIVAGAMTDATVHALATRLPVAVVVGGYTSRGTDGLVATENAPALAVGEFGWYVTRIDFDEHLGATDARQAWLDPEVPDDPDVAALVARAQAAMLATGEEYSAGLLAKLRSESFDGSASCAACHAAEYAVWSASGHAHAMQTLVVKKKERDPTCVSCHLGDLPPPAAPGQAAVPVTSLGLGCETCHGGGRRHAELARENRLASSPKLPRVTEETCLRCHFPPNDTHFEFAKKWPKIAHGRSADSR